MLLSHPFFALHSVDKREAHMTDCGEGPMHLMGETDVRGGPPPDQLCQEGLPNTATTRH